MNKISTFLANPYQENYDAQTSKFASLATAVFFAVAATLVVGLIKALYISMFPNHIAELNHEYINVINPIRSKYGYLTPLVIIAFGPLIEEIVFRLGLSFKRVHVITSFVCLLFILNYNFYPSSVLLNIIALLLSVLILLILHHTTKNRFDEIRKKYGRFAVHLFALLFAVIHLSNFQSIQYKYIFDYLIYLLPLIILSYTLIFIRIRVGFIYVVAFHALNNAIVFISNY